MDRMLLARARYVVAITALWAGFFVIGLAAQAPRAAASGPVGGSIAPAACSVLAAPTTAHTGGIHVYDALVIARVHLRAGGTVDLAPTMLGVLPEGSSRPSLRAPWASTTPRSRSVATNTVDDGARLALGSGRFPNANFAPGQLEAHFAKHADEWGAIGQDAYLARARSMLGSEPGGNLVGFVRRNGDVLRYNVRTNEFAVGSSSGVIRTLFRPDDGMDYWLKQVAAG